MNRLFKTTLLVAAMLPAIAVAAPVAGDREVALGGAGSSDKDFDDTVFSLQGSWGTYLDESSMWGVRQTVNARDSEGESVQFDGSTRVFYDYHRKSVSNTGYRTRRSSLLWPSINSSSKVEAMRGIVTMTVRSFTASVSATTTEAYECDV